jgi:hypothetical protein
LALVAKKNGYNVPFAIFLPAMRNLGNIDLKDLKEALSSFEINGLYDVAVRSSCTLEDAEEYSLAGHFLTIFKTDVIQANFTELP